MHSTWNMSARSPDDAGESGVQRQVAYAQDVQRRQTRVDARHLDVESCAYCETFRHEVCACLLC